MEASAQGHVGLVNMLLRYRADIDATGKVHGQSDVNVLIVFVLYNL